MLRITIAICFVSTSVCLSAVVLAQDFPPISRCGIGVIGLPKLTSHHCRAIPFQISASKCGIVIVDGRVSHFGIVGPDKKFHHVQSIKDFRNFNGRLIDFCLSDEEGTMAAINVDTTGRVHALILKEGQKVKEQTFGDLKLPIASSSTTQGKRSIAWVNDSAGRLCVAELANGVPALNSHDLQLGNTIAFSSFGNTAAVLREKDSQSIYSLSLLRWSGEHFEELDRCDVSHHGLGVEIVLVNRDRLLVCKAKKDEQISFEILSQINQKSLVTANDVRDRSIVVSGSASGQSVALVVHLNDEHYRLHVFRLSGLELRERSRLSFASGGLDTYEDFVVSWIGESPVVGWRCFAPID